MSTPIIQNLLPLVASHARSQAADFLQGGSAISGTVDQEIWSFLAPHDIEWDGLTSDEQDQIRDGYLESFKAEAARRLTTSDPGPSLCTGVMAMFTKVEIDMMQSQIAAKDSQIKLLREKLKDCESALERAQSAPAASGVIPAPSVPDAVKIAVEALERIKNWHCDCTWPESYRDDIRATAESALSALRLLTAEGGPEVPSPEADVPPLVDAVSMAVDALSWAVALIDHEAKEYKATNGYQIATNTLAGLRKVLHAHDSISPPSSEDKELLDWLNEKIVSIIELDDFTLIDVRGNCVRDAIRSAKAKDQQASATPQKEGKES